MFLLSLSWNNVEEGRQILQIFVSFKPQAYQKKKIETENTCSYEFSQSSPLVQNVQQGSNIDVWQTVKMNQW